jgi:hypothetical protein
MVVEVRGVEGGSGIVFIGAERRWSGRAKHAVLVRPVVRSVRLCRRRDVSGSDEFMAVATRWCCGQDPSGRSGGGRAGRVVTCGGGVLAGGVMAAGRRGVVSSMGRRGVEKQRLDGSAAERGR